MLQDPRQSTRGDRRRPRHAQQARVSYIRTPEALAEAIAALSREPLVAADTEAASFHRYHDRIFLIQLSSPSRTEIIDPLAVADRSPVRRLRARLTALGRLAWAEEEFARLEDLGWTGAADGAGPDAFLRVKGAKALTPRQLAALRELYRWREGVAAEQDRATFRIIGNDALLAVARVLPRAPAELRGIAALPPSLAARHGPALLDGVQRALALAESELPRVERAPRQARDPAVEARVERLKAVRNRAAAELALDPGVLCGRSILEAVARAQPPPNDRAGLARIGELRRWQIEAFGDALLETLEQP